MHKNGVPFSIKLKIRHACWLKTVKYGVLLHFELWQHKQVRLENGRKHNAGRSIPTESTDCL